MMIRPRIRAAGVLAAIVAVALIWPAAADAQEPAPTAARPALSTGQFVWIATADGRTARGRVESVSDREVTFVVRSSVTRIAWADIRRIEAEVPDSVLDGALIGAAIGGAGGGLTGLLVMHLICSECENGDEARQVALGVAAIGAAVGALIDAQRHRRREVFRSSGLTIAPALVRRGAAIAAVIRW